MAANKALGQGTASDKKSNLVDDASSSADSDGGPRQLVQHSRLLALFRPAEKRKKMPKASPSGRGRSQSTTMPKTVPPSRSRSRSPAAHRGKAASGVVTLFVRNSQASDAEMAPAVVTPQKVSLQLAVQLRLHQHPRRSLQQRQQGRSMCR